MKSHSIWRGLGFAFEGLRYAFRSQRSLRIESGAAVIVVAAGFVLDISKLEWIAVTIALSLIIALELVNTAIEAVVDLVSPDYHPVAKVAKDAASAAVLVSAIGGLIVGAIVCLPG